MPVIIIRGCLFVRLFVFSSSYVILFSKVYPCVSPLKPIHVLTFIVIVGLVKRQSPTTYYSYVIIMVCWLFLLFFANCISHLFRDHLPFLFDSGEVILNDDSTITKVLLSPLFSRLLLLLQ
ncbi:hypothetical protein MN116_005898 [Schistosoma mekongi]|uniref:Uncharacterized protein n=1 Tax=Schistosoma mekongi TaxID=38744 RepID=A0AAE2D3Z0_SCHME|nr:hypothetical protein MN116_005898 [Schistosoma mekongi]